jgi:hypothetical protein
MPLRGWALSNLVLVSGSSERRAARSVVAEYHQAQLGDLVARVGDAVDRYRAGALDAFDVAVDGRQRARGVRVGGDAWP